MRPSRTAIAPQRLLSDPREAHTAVNDGGKDTVASESFALGVNERGVIVGRVATSLDPDEPTRAAMWTPVRR